MSEHTKEPWEFVATMADIRCAQIATGDETKHSLFLEAAEIDLDDIADGSLDYSLEEIEANALRIVAAVNACAGIPTEELEKGIVGEMVEHLKSDTEWCVCCHGSGEKTDYDAITGAMLSDDCPDCMNATAILSRLEAKP